VTSKSGQFVRVDSDTIRSTVFIGFTTSSAGTFTIATSGSPINVLVDGIQASGAANISSVSTTATIISTTAPYNTTESTASTSPITVQLKNSDGSIDLAAPLTIANGFKISVRDPDRNIDTTSKESLQVGNANISPSNPASAADPTNNSVSATDDDVKYNITGPATGLQVTTTGSLSGTITLVSDIDFSATNITGPTTPTSIPASAITITAPSGFTVTSKSGQFVRVDSDTIRSTVFIGFTTSSAGTFTIATSGSPINVLVDGIQASGAANISSVSTTATIAPNISPSNPASAADPTNNSVSATDDDVKYNITGPATGLQVTTTGSLSGTITLVSDIDFSATNITGPTTPTSIPASAITITAPSGFTVTSKSGQFVRVDSDTIRSTVFIGFTTSSAGTFTIATSGSPINVLVDGIQASGAANISSVSTTATINISDVTINGIAVGVVFKESDNNTNTFIADLAGNKIEIVPLAGTTLTLPSGVNNAGNIVPGKIVLGDNSKIYVLASVIKDDEDLTITYTDFVSGKTFSIVRKIQHFAGSISTTTTSVPVTGKAVIEINDMDLNLNPDAIDIYTLTYTTSGTAPSSSTPNLIGANGLANLTIKVNGQTSNIITGSLSVQLVETGNNTGVFRGDIDVSKLRQSGGGSLTDGDKITVEYKDNTERPELTRSVDVKIGKPSGTVELDRSSYPPTITSVGTTKLHITITDPSFNSSSTSQNVLTLKDADNIFENGELRIQLIKSIDTITIQPGFLGTDGNPLTITPSGLSFPTSANETGVNTGVFTVDVDLPRQVTIGTTTYTIDDGWQIRVIYKDSNGDDQTATATVTTNTAQITTDKPTYDLGQTIILRVVEPDWNFDSDKVDEIDLSALGSDFVVNSDKVSDRHIETLDDISGISLDPSSTIRETGKNTGIFEIKIKNINSNLVSRGKNLEFTYTDKTPSGGGTEIEVKHTVLISSATVDIIFDKETYTPFDRVLVSIVDPAANQDPDTKDKFTGTDARVRVIVGGTSSTLTNDFEETEANSGVFRYKPNDKGILITGINPNAKPGDGIRVEYRSPDKQTEISKSVQIVFTNGTISLDKDSYKPGETAVITINDPDENRNPDTPDQFEVKVVSTTDPTGIKVTVRETGDRTGVFKAEVVLTTDLSSGNRLQVREGDQITAIYTDETLPNAQTINQQLVNRNQQGLRTLQTLDVQASAVVGVLLAPTERTAVAKPSLRDQAGNVLTQASVDVPVSIASSIKNNTQQPQKFVYIVQVKDADGFVVSISTVGGTLPAGQSFDVSASWTPTAAGTYTIEVFVWNELGKPSPLSKVESATVRAV
jgi:hypothetical protein